MRPAVLAVAVLLVTSGCSSLLAPPEAAEATPTLTAAPAPTPEAAYPPGVRPDSVAVFGLLEAHVAALSGVSYTVVETRTLRGVDGAVLVSVTEENRVAAERLVAPQGTANGSLVDSEVVVQGLVRNPDGARERPNAVRHGTPRNVEWLGSLVARATFRVEADGDRFRLVATGVDGETLVVAGRRVENVTVGDARLVVTQEGRIDRARLTYQGTVDGTVVTGVETVEYEAVGSTTVREPARRPSGSRRGSPRPLVADGCVSTACRSSGSGRGRHLVRIHLLRFGSKSVPMPLGRVVDTEMASSRIGIEPDDVYYPRFHHGDDLYVFVRRDGTFRFQSEFFAYVDADNVVYLDDWV
ncbi:hypothetical protein [Halorarius litoreus]|uniref:hypothetical protein n=1 Tax=Halorarius litoreus TaxID=2962676 RepID=UPI0020CEAA81|nr:hypothetical protein [Halorarius litoreus]